MPISDAIKYASAVVLIVSSIVLAFIVSLRIDDIPSGILLYIAQAFLLAGSIFGLEYYRDKFREELEDARGSEL